MSTDPRPTRAEIADQIRVVRAAQEDVDQLLRRAAAPAVAPTAPPAADLRDRIAHALDNANHTHPCPATGDTYWTGCYHRDGTGPSCHTDRRTAAVLAVLPALTDPAAAEQPADRRARYAAAIRDTDGWVLDGGQHMVDAVMAVADAEQAELRLTLDHNSRYITRLDSEYDSLRAEWAALRAEVERLRADRATTLREVEAVLRAQGKQLTGEYNDSDILHEEGAIATVAAWGRAADAVRRLADEAQQPETEARSWSCAHCGTTIRHVVGTLAAWWVHDLGGKTACYPQQKCSTVAAPAPTEEPTR